MIKSGQAYHAAITGDARRVLLRAVIDIISPDIVFGAGEIEVRHEIQAVRLFHMPFQRGQGNGFSFPDTSDEVILCFGFAPGRNQSSSNEARADGGAEHVFLPR